MRVLVTGAAGFSGRTIARRLLADGHEVVAHHRAARLPDDLMAVEVWQADLADDPSVPARLDAIVHCAAASPETGASGHVATADLIRSNAVATARLATAGAGCVVYLSSLSVHGRITDDPVTPATPVVDPDPYGASKRLGEMVVAETGVPALALRLPAVIGPGAARNWPVQVLKRLRAGQTVSVFNPDSPFNNVVHVDDLAAFVARILPAPPAGFSALPLASADPIPVREAVAALARAAGTTARIEEQAVSRHSFTIDWSVAGDLGFAPRATETALRDYAGQELAGEEAE